MNPRPIHSVSPIELVRFGVWEFSYASHEIDETCVLPVMALPVSTLDGRVVASEIRLNNGTSVPALLGNVSLQDSDRNRHFLTLTLYGKNAKAFHLSRYHDADFETSGPPALAAFLGLSLSDVFPISYDLSKVAVGPTDCVVGTIPSAASNRLSPSELIDLALSNI